MKEKIFLEENRSVDATNIESFIRVGLSGKNRLMSEDNISETLSLYEQYNKERDACDKFRLILAVNPICSNILYNMKSEIVVNEGGDNCKVVYDANNGGLDKATYARNAVNTTTPITYRQAISDTEYSHKDNGKFVYHCGMDIFNNHMLRALEFAHVNKINTRDTSSGKVYNTIRDYLRDGKGDIIREDIYTSYQKRNNEKVPLHLYRYDSILSMQDAFYDRCKEVDGWWGFTNPGYIEIPTNSTNSAITVNMMMADNKRCEFIDLYPDRSLFSFIPKFNKERNRTEKNWDYCITYPYKKDEEKLNEICGGQNGAIRANIKVTRKSSKSPRLECSSYFKHNLNVGDTINVYYYYPMDTTNTFQKYTRKIRIIGLGDENNGSYDRIFVISYSEVEDILPYLEEGGFFYKKIVNGNECSYYFRKFKKIKVLEENINGEVTDRDLRSDTNKIAFGRNIYGDDVSQILVLDDVDTEGLLDCKGKPLSEVYFTVVKRNAGNELWYKDKEYDSSEVEFSHCFGKVTSAIDFSGIEDEPFDYNIHYLHNLNKYTDSSCTEYTIDYESYDSVKNTFSAWGETINNHPTPLTLEDNLTIDNDEFYGDIVEFDLYNFQETVIGNVYHRFNTAQRETFDRGYMNIYNDAFVADDFDYANGSNTPFTVATYYVNSIKSATESADGVVPSSHLVHGNVCPEGYFYNPHTRIQLKSEDDVVRRETTKIINYSECKLMEVVNDLTSYYKIVLKVPTDFGFVIGDFIGLYDVVSGNLFWGEIMQFKDNEITLFAAHDAFDSIGYVKEEYFIPDHAERRIYAIWCEKSVPFYTKYSPENKKYIWRTNVLPSKLSINDSLYNTTFSNGRFYIEKNINFFLRRQDPTGEYGLSTPLFKTTSPSVPNPMSPYVIQGNLPMDLTQIAYMIDNSNNCY